MKHTLILAIACLLLFAKTLSGGVVQALPMTAITEPSLPSEEASSKLIQDLKTKIIPEIENILTPEQNEQIKAEIIEGKKSLRKAFKTLVLTPDQKTKIAAVFKALPSKEILVTMTPDEKKSFFIKQKSIFMPTPEEIGEKISAKQKIANVGKDKSSFAPSAKSISKKIGQKMEFLKDKLTNLSE